MGSKPNIPPPPAPDHSMFIQDERSGVWVKVDNMPKPVINCRNCGAPPSADGTCNYCKSKS